MRRGLILGGTLLMVAMLLPACGLPFVTERGSGNLVTEARNVSGFDEILLSGNGEVKVAITGTESLTVETDDNIMPLLEIEVRGSRLELGARRSISPSRPPIYTITAADLERVAISGSGRVTVTGLAAGEFTVDISGSGEIEPAGATGRLEVDISGSGEFFGESLVAGEGEVRVSGSGYALVNVSDRLDVSISGSGNVEYLGSPQLSVSESGSGNVSARD